MDKIFLFVLSAIFSLLVTQATVSAQENYVFLEFTSRREQTSVNTFVYDDYTVRAVNQSPSAGPAYITTPGTKGTIEVTNFGFNESFDSEIALSEVYGSGQYDFSIDVDEELTQMPSVDSTYGFKHMTLLDFNGIQNIDTTQDFTFTWTVPNGMGADDFYNFSIDDPVTFANIGYGFYVDGDTASYTVLANSFLPGRLYSVILDFYSPNTVVAGEFGSSVAYQSDTVMNFTTSTVPEPGSIALFALAACGILGWHAHKFWSKVQGLDLRSDKEVS